MTTHHTLETIGKSQETSGKKIDELHKGLLPHYKKVETWADKLLKIVEKSGFSVVIIGLYSIFLVWLGARLF